MFLSGSSYTETLLGDIPTLSETLQRKAEVFTLPLSHAVTANPGTSDRVVYFGVSPAVEANETGADRYFYFPSAVKVVGIISTVSVLSPGQGTKNNSDATIGLQNATTGEFINLHVSHDYSKTFDTVRGAGKNIIVKGSDKFRIRVAIPGYSQANPSNYTHQITLLLENLIPNVSYCGFEQGNSALQWNDRSYIKKFAKFGTGSFLADTYGLIGSYVIRPVLTKEWLTVYDNDPRGTGLFDPLVNPATISLNDASPGGLSIFVEDELGVEFSSYPTVARRPYFLEEGKLVNRFDQTYRTIITGGSGNYVNFPGYTEWWQYQPNISRKYRLGAKSVNLPSGPYDTPDSTGDGYYGLAFTFAVGKKEQINAATNLANAGRNWYFLKVRIGILVDTVNDSQYCPDYISVSVYIGNTGDGTSATTFSEKIPKNGIPKLVVFELDTAPNARYYFSFWKTSGPGSVAAFSTVTID